MNVKTGLLAGLCAKPKAESAKHQTNETPGTYLLKKIKQEYVIILLSILAILLQLLIVIRVVTAQEKQSEGLKIGDKVPDVTIEHLINYLSKTATLSDFKGKLLILDFWSPSCGACISGMPHLDSLQKRYSGKLQILLVGFEKEERLRKSFAVNPILKAHPLPSVTEDTLLKSLFPYSLIPHIVWINGEGKVEAITSDKELIPANIDQVLNGKPVRLPLKDDNVSYNPQKPLLVSNNGGADSNFLFRSLIAGRLPGIRSEIAIRKNPEQKTLRLLATNTDILSLYRLAWPELYRLPANRILLPSRDSSSFLFSDDHKNSQAFLQKGIFCYDLMLPLSAERNARPIMRQSLDVFFKVHSGMEERETEVWSLVRASTGKLSTKGEKPLVNTDRGPVKIFRNQPLSSLTEWLNDIPGMLPVLDETGYSANADLALNIQSGTAEELSRELGRYGLELRESRRQLRFFVIRPDHPDPSAKPITLYH